jgi:hemerythrin
MIEFTDDLRTYVPEIDKQHKALIDILNALNARGAKLHDKAKTEKALQFLGRYIVIHFTAEEKIMIETGYTEYDWHHTWHHGYIKKYESLKEEYENSGPSEEYTYILNEFIIKWIVKHIQNVDRVLGKHILAYRKAYEYRK